jgi:hypothetical protein
MVFFGSFSSVSAVRRGFVASSRHAVTGMNVMEDQIARELRSAIDRNSDTPELRELWLRVLGLQLLAEDLTQQAKEQTERAQELFAQERD